MIVRVTFEKGTWLFGNSYKDWDEQFDEFVRMMVREKEDHLGELKVVRISRSKWIGWGGAKWIGEDRFQHRLNREGCQDEDPDNPKSRQYKKMSFYYSREYAVKCKEALTRWASRKKAGWFG